MDAVSFQHIELRDSYTVVARYMDGVKVIGYHLVDNNGSGQAVTKEIVEKMALAKNITNVAAQRYKDEIVIKGINCKLTELPVIDASSGKIKGAGINNKKKTTTGQFNIIARITKGKITVGYVLKDTAGTEKKLRRDDVLALARGGKIINARAQLYSGNLLLRGVGFELAQLQTIKV